MMQTTGKVLMELQLPWAHFYMAEYVLCYYHYCSQPSYRTLTTVHVFIYSHTFLTQKGLWPSAQLSNTLRHAKRKKISFMDHFNNNLRELSCEEKFTYLSRLTPSFEKMEKWDRISF